MLAREGLCQTIQLTCMLQGWWAWLRGQDRAPNSKEQDTDTRLQVT